MSLHTAAALFLSCLGTASLALALNDFLRDRRTMHKQEAQIASRIKTEVLAQLAPLLEEARFVADTFDGHMAEKRLIVSELNGALEKKISSLTLLLNRADAMITREEAPREQEDNARQRIFDSRQKVLALASKGVSVDEIASRLSLPKGEVALVVNLHNPS